jgi:hypothetical protein
MATFGTTAPVESVTCPEISPEVCANTAEADNNERDRNSQIRVNI